MVHVITRYTRPEYTYSSHEQQFFESLLIHPYSVLTKEQVYKNWCSAESCVLFVHTQNPSTGPENNEVQTMLENTIFQRRKSTTVGFEMKRRGRVPVLEQV